MGSSHTRDHRSSNVKTKAELVQELKDLQDKVAPLTDELRRKDRAIEGLAARNEELTRVTDALRESEKIYHSLFEMTQENLSLLEVITDEKGCPADYRFLDVNPALELYSGISRDRLVGRKYSDIMAAGGGAAEQKWFDIICRVSLTGKAESGEHYAVSTGRWAQFYAFSPCHGKCAVVSVDITERKKAEEALRESEDKYRNIIETANEGVWGIDITAHTIFVNQKMADMLGYTIEEMIGHSAFDFIFPERHQKGEAIRLEALAGKKIFPDLQYKRKDGSTLWAIVSSSPLYNSKGETVGSFGMYTDITGRKKIEQDLADSKSQAELYLDLMGHDISNMHQIAMAQLELAQETMDEEGGLKIEDKELIDTPLETLNRSARLIDNVRNLQKLKAGEFKEKSIDLNDLLSGIIKEYELMLPASSIKFVSDGPGRVMANKLLHDVFGNIIGNAIKHSNRDRIDIIIKLENAGDNGKNCYKVSVEDNGPGIPDDMKEKIFNRLQRGDTKAKGLGLGLYLAKSLVESYRGRVMVEDRVPGDHRKGSRFIVYLPVAEGEHGKQ